MQWYNLRIISAAFRLKMRLENAGALWMLSASEGEEEDKGAKASEARKEMSALSGEESFPSVGFPFKA